MTDISRAYFNAKTDGEYPTYVEFPSEMDAPPGMRGLLRRHMYGTRRAAEGWQEEYSTRLCVAGFTQGEASPCVFTHRERAIAVSVHGEDFTAAGPTNQLDWFEGVLRGHYELTVGGKLGPGPSDDKEATVFNHIISWAGEGVEYEADPRQAEKLLEELELAGEGVKGVVTPGQKIPAHQVRDEQELPEDQHTHFRALAARATFLAADSPDGIMFAAKEIFRFVSKSTSIAQGALKRLGRYLKTRPRLVFR